jgi:hypothetical protein
MESFPISFTAVPDGMARRETRKSAASLRASANTTRGRGGLESTRSFMVIGVVAILELNNHLFSEVKLITWWNGMV